jgi:hypothetical protein
MSRRVGTGAWLPLMEYSVNKGISLSTLRRYIKARKVEFRIENGRYLLFDEAADPSNAPVVAARGADGNTALVSRLEQDLKKAREEIAELKTLIALYEETPPSRPAQSLDH